MKISVEGMRLDVNEIAQICHETNRIYCILIGDNSQPTWENAPDWQKESAIRGVSFHAEQLAKGIKPSNSASHDSWLEEKRNSGWTYGPIKDAELKEHPCFVPYNELPLEQRIKDSIFGNIVEAIFGSYLKEYP